MADDRVTFWFWFQGHCIGSVRASAHYSDNEARGAAIAQHERTPLPYEGMTPAEYAEALRFSEVRRYSDSTGERITTEQGKP